MKEQLICFETAKLASEKGFNIPVRNAFFEDGREDAEKFIMCYDCEGGMSLGDWDYNYNDSHRYISRPTQSLLQRWLREIHDINMIIEFVDHKGNSKYGASLYYKEGEGQSKELEYWKDSDLFDTYEEALEDGLSYALKSIK